MRKPFFLLEVDVMELSRVIRAVAGDALGSGELGGVIYTIGGPWSSAAPLDTRGTRLDDGIGDRTCGTGDSESESRDVCEPGKGDR